MNIPTIRVERTQGSVLRVLVVRGDDQPVVDITELAPILTITREVTPVGPPEVQIDVVAYLEEVEVP